MRALKNGGRHDKRIRGDQHAPRCGNKQLAGDVLERTAPFRRRTYKIILWWSSSIDPSCGLEAEATDLTEATDFAPAKLDGRCARSWISPMKWGSEKVRNHKPGDIGKARWILHKHRRGVRIRRWDPYHSAGNGS